MPALLTKTCSPPCWVTVVSTRLRTSSSSVTSQRGGLGQIGVEVGDDDVCAVLVQGCGDRESDALGRAGDDGDLVVEQSHGATDLRGR
jgi:hypothetical protein